MASAPSPSAPVRRRHVFYVPGFDPFPARRYRELYRSEGAAQAALSGYRLIQGPGASPGDWSLVAEIEGTRTETQVEVLVWSDIVRASMGAGLVQTYGQMLRTAWIYLSSGALGRMAKLRKGPVIAALYPVVALVVQLVLALGAAALLGAVLALWSPLAAWAGLLVVWPLLRLFKRWDRTFYVHYLMHDYAFAARWRGAHGPPLEARLALFRDRVRAALAGPVDEVLVVGHSSGAPLAVSLVADVLRGDGGRGPPLALLTLGQVVPMLSFLPRATRLRADLAYLAVSDQVTWVDVTAPADGCAFALCDPVAVSGVAPPNKRWPLVISAAFSQTLRPETWAALRWRFLKLHFQYLCAFDQPGSYDYFQITAGPKTLAARYAGRAPSQSRDERPVNRHTSRAA